MAFFPIVNSVSDLVHRFYDDLWNRWDDALVPDVLEHGFDWLYVAVRSMLIWRHVPVGGDATIH